MSQHPKNWQSTTSGEICEYITSGSRDWKSFYSDHGPLFVRTQDINQDRLDLSGVAHVDLPAKVEGKRSRIQSGDLLVTITGANVGKVALVPDEIPEAYVSQSVGLMRLKDKRHGPYLHYYLQSDQTGRKQVLNLVYGIGRPVLSLQNLRDIPVALPPLPEQRRIVAEIEKQFTRLEAGVVALRRVQANLKRYRAAVLKAACEGRLVPTEAELAKAENSKFETGQELLGRILTGRRKNWQGRGSFVEPAAPDTSILPKLPACWTWARVEQLSHVVRGASPRPAGDPRYFGGNVPWITVGPLTADNSPYLKSVPASLNQLGREHSRYIEPQTLLLTNSGATLGVPKITLIGGCINDGVAALLDVDYPLKLYFLYFLRTQTKGLRGVNQGAAQPNLNTTIIKDINVPLPPLAEQTRIVAEVERRLSVVEELESVVTANLQRSIRLRQSVLKTAFSECHE
jgi:type I restriction enzyme, S subunit